MSDRETREAERRAAADPSDEAAAERARALRWRAGRPTVTDRVGAILDDLRATQALGVTPARVYECAEPHVSGASAEDRYAVAEGLTHALGWSPLGPGIALRAWSPEVCGTWPTVRVDWPS